MFREKEYTDGLHCISCLCVVEWGKGGNTMRKTGKIIAMLLALLFCLCACAGYSQSEEAQIIHLDEVTAQEETVQQDTEEEQETPEEEQEEQGETSQTETEDSAPPQPAQEAQDEGEETVSESGEYTSKDDVARYIYLYGHLPGNFITKKEAKALGWVSSEGNLGKVAPGKSIGGDYFGNYEGNLPKADGREYHECDIDSDGSYRGPKRIVFSNDGLIYYTEDHYNSFELLYGEE